MMKQISRNNTDKYYFGKDNKQMLKILVIPLSIIKFKGHIDYDTYNNNIW